MTSPKPVDFAAGVAVTPPHRVVISGQFGAFILAAAHIQSWMYVGRGTATVDTALRYEPASALEGFGLPSQGESFMYIERSPVRVSIWKRIAHMADEMPADEAAKLPTDAAENLDHYLYAIPNNSQ
jgi:hypothetical protein